MGYGNALIVSSIPVWLYWRVHNIDPASSAFIFAAVILASTWLVSFAYRNTKHLLKHRVAGKRRMKEFFGRRTRLLNTNPLRLLFSTTTLSSSQFLFLPHSTFSPPQLVQQSIMLLAWEFLLDLLHYCPLEQRQHN